MCLTTTHRLHSSSFLGLNYRILKIHLKKELLGSLWVRFLKMFIGVDVIEIRKPHSSGRH